ncbi:MAG: PorV/PorQ family protein [Elusimicrobiales bacterium]|nr:PorV/PorQ family protein [Elusimicrobiales bacterium]
MKTTGALLLAAFLASGQAAQAASDNGTVSGAFLRLPTSASGAGMGDSGVAVSAGSPAIFMNPAGLASVKGGFASFSHAAWADTLTFNVLSAAVRTRYGGVAGVGLRYLSYGKMNALDNTGAPAGSLSPRDLAAEGGLGWDLDNATSLGISVKYISSRIKRTATAYAADAGITRRAGGVVFGAALQNAGSGLKFGTEEYPLPLNLRLGVGVPYSRDMLGVFDINITRGSTPWLAFGGKYTYLLQRDLALVLRAGYNTAAIDTGGINGFALGFGLSMPSTAFDYSLRTMGELGPTHHIGVSFKWDVVYHEQVDQYGPAPAPRPRQRVVRYR